jgi:hypothetical protein
MNRDHKIFTVYFELFGKKMKTSVKADSIYAAQAKIKDKIIFHKCEERPLNEDEQLVDVMEMLNRVIK